jgi:hypothetical protein
MAAEPVALGLWWHRVSLWEHMMCELISWWPGSRERDGKLAGVPGLP